MSERETSMNERALVVEALKRSDTAERAAYLEQACAGDAALLRRIALLLKAGEKASVVLTEIALADTAIAPPDLSSPPTATKFAPSAEPAGTLPLEEGPGDASSDATGFATPHGQQATLDIADEPGNSPAAATKLLSTGEQFDPCHDRAGGDRAARCS